MIEKNDSQFRVCVSHARPLGSSEESKCLLSPMVLFLILVVGVVHVLKGAFLRQFFQSVESGN